MLFFILLARFSIFNFKTIWILIKNRKKRSSVRLLIQALSFFSGYFFPFRPFLTFSSSLFSFRPFLLQAFFWSIICYCEIELRQPRGGKKERTRLTCLRKKAKEMGPFFQRKKERSRLWTLNFKRSKRTIFTYIGLNTCFWCAIFGWCINLPRYICNFDWTWTVFFKKKSALSF